MRATRRSHAHLALHRHGRFAPDAVVMEMEKCSVSAGGSPVTMEIPIAAAAAAAEQAEPVSVQHHGQRRAAAAAAAAPQHRRHRMLIVVGEVSTSHHLDAARKQITQGEEGGGVGGGTSIFRLTDLFNSGICKKKTSSSRQFREL